MTSQELEEANQALTVSGLTERVKQVLQRSFGEIWVRGEVSNLRRQASGHLYFTLKDDGAQISAVMFRGNATRQAVELRDGMEVVVFAELSLYPPRGTYQLIVRFVVEAGLGALQRRFEALKAKLTEEGLFAPERKRPIPEMPARVVVITSASGAALRDFLSILSRREWAGNVRILPVRVQGNEAAPEIVAMLERANAEGWGEVVVLTRGGGSLEDLWPFNEEVVARAVASSRIPVISAVGHEIDFTLSDFAADRRAETPSAAAELISSAFVRFAERFARARRDFGRSLEHRLERERRSLQLWGQALRAQSPQTRVEQAWLRLDDLRSRQAHGVERRLGLAARRLEQTAARLQRREPTARLAAARESLGHLSKRLISASPQSVVARGFAIVRDEKGRVLSELKGAPQGAQVELEMRDGRGRFRRDEPLVQDEWNFGEGSR